jgi:hypothetical protein
MWRVRFAVLIATFFFRWALFLPLVRLTAKGPAKILHHVCADPLR